MLSNGTGFYPRYDLEGRTQHTKMDPGFGNMPSARIGSAETPETTDFKSVMSGLVEKFNSDLNAPDGMLKDVMAGNDDVDIHDVMTAMAKAEINVNVATQFTGKIIQTYDKIMQLQV